MHSGSSYNSQHAGRDRSLFFFSWGGVRLSPHGTLATNWTIEPALDGDDDDDEYGVDVGIRIGRGNCSEKACRSTTLSATNPT
jgi:hypothetical protein